MKDSLNILVIDDDETDLMMVRHLFAKTNLKINVEEATDCKSGVEKN